MKYIVIVMVAMMLVRIDMIILGVEKIGEKLRKMTFSSMTGIQSAPQPDNIISIKEDQNLSRTPKSEFFTLLDDFQHNPDRNVREKLAEVLHKNPNILGPKLDLVFEGKVFKMADLIYNKNPELPLLLTDFLGLFEGENQDMVRRFFTILMDNDLERFLKAYAATKDTNCLAAGLMGHRVPEEELLNEYEARQAALEKFLAQGKMEPAVMELAKNCHLVVKLQIDKLVTSRPKPGPPSESVNTEADPETPAITIIGPTSPESEAP